MQLYRNVIQKEPKTSLVHGHRALKKKKSRSLTDTHQ